MILLILQLWVSIPDRDTILQGNWQSCRQEHVIYSPEFKVETSYGERVYDYQVNGQLKWSFHMGPMDEFALFKVGAEPVPDTHDTPQNLLTTIALSKHRIWTIRSLKLRIEVVQAGGSRDDCQSYFVKIKELK